MAGWIFLLSGQVYKLRTPNAAYLASLSTYDSSNPTKDWEFPELSVDRHSLPFSKSSGNHVLKTAAGASISKDFSTLLDNLSESEKVTCIIKISDLKLMC